jgi:hypothetical protein
LTWVLSLRKLGAIFDYFLDRIDKTIFIENHPMITISLKEAQAQLPDLIHNLKLGELDSGKFSSRVSEKRKSDMRYPRVPLCPKLADIENR